MNVEAAAPPPASQAGPRKRRGLPRALRFVLAPILGYAHPGAFGYVGFLCIGLALDLLSLPPGPFPFLVLIVDVPFLIILFLRGGTRWKRWAWMYGMLHFGFALRWLGEIHPVQVLGCALVLGPIYVLLGGAIRWAAARRAPFAFSVGICVVLEEFVRTFWMGGMPWPARSLSFTGEMPLDLGLAALLPAAAFVGAYGFSFLAGMTSGVVYRLVRLPGETGGANAGLRLGAMLRAFAPPLAFLLLLLVLVVVRRGQVGEDGPDPQARQFLVVQADVPQSLKHGDEGGVKEMFDRHLSISASAVRQVGAPNVLGILWPETMVPWPFLDADLAHRFPDYWQHQVGVVKRLKADVPEAQHVPWLLGAIHKFRRPGQQHWSLWADQAYGTHDSLYLLDPSQAPDMAAPTPLPPPPGTEPPWVRARHDKRQLVPGGEYTPLGDLLPPLRWFRNVVSVIPELDPGAEDQAPWRLGAGPDEVQVGTIICFEVAFPARCRAWRRAGAQVLLNASNYGWFGRTGFRWQVAALAKLRAAELGATVVMAGNTGPTAFYGPLGETYGRFRGIDDAADGPAGPISTTYRRGWAAARLRVDHSGPTPYTRFGDAVWLLAVLGVLGSVLIRSRFRPIQSSHREAPPG